VLLCRKELTFVPPIEILAILMGTMLVLVSVIAWAALSVPTSCPLKLRLAGDKVTTGCTAVPLRLKLCGLPVALPVKIRDAFRLPAVAGRNVTAIEQ